MPTYDNESFLQSLDNQRADVTQAVQNALAEVNRQRDTGINKATQIRRNVSDATSRATNRFRHGVAGGDSALQALGLFNAAGGEDSSMDARRDSFRNMGELRGAYGKASHLLGTGFREQADQRHGQVDSISKGIYGDIDAKRNEYIARREAEDRQRALQEELSRRQMAMQQQALAQQAALARQSMAAASSEGAKNRSWAEQQKRAEFFYEALKQKAPTMSIDDVRAMHTFGLAPQGMGVNDFAQWLGVPMPRNSLQTVGGRSGGTPLY